MALFVGMGAAIAQSQNRG